MSFKKSYVYYWRLRLQEDYILKQMSFKRIYVILIKISLKNVVIVVMYFLSKKIKMNEDTCNACVKRLEKDNRIDPKNSCFMEG